MSIPRVNKCCCCTVETGVVIIAVLCVLGGVSKCGTGTNFLVNSQAYNIITARQTGVTLITFGSLSVLIGGIMFFAVYKHKHILLLPYLIIAGLEIIAFIIVIFVIFIAVLIKQIYPAVLLFEIILGLILSLFVYMWIVVYSHYVVLKEENARGQYDKQAYRAT